MKRSLLICCFLLLTGKIFGQQFLQYNTGTLYDSFENPAQRSFIPDSSRMFAFNFFIPNFNTTTYLTGDAQATVRSRAFSGYYNTASLEVGNNRYNHFNLNLNNYAIMAKVYTSLGGDQELGFFVNTRAEGRATFTDESLAIFNGYLNFPNNVYDNIFNDNIRFQAYHQIGFSYRERVSRSFAFGFKVSALSGINHTQVDVDRSSIVFDKPADEAILSLHGRARISEKLTGATMLQKSGLAFKNAGAAISLGTSYRNEDGYNFQFNVKNLGFIKWKGSGATFSNDTALIQGITGPDREVNIRNKVDRITNASGVRNGFTSVTNGVAEISANKNYWFDYEKEYRFSPTLIMQKELFYDGFTAALVAPVTHNNTTLSLSAAYNDLKLLSVGGQFMIKSPNAEFFIGSDRLFQTAHLAANAIRGNNMARVQEPRSYGGYSGADIFIGASFKLGQFIENPMNSPTMRDGEKGFFGKLFDKWFNKDPNY